MSIGTVVVDMTSPLYLPDQQSDLLHFTIVSFSSGFALRRKAK